MALSPSVEKVLKQVEEVTGLPVHVEPDSTLPQNILANLTIARGEIPFHVIGFQPSASAAPDYLIVYQCGFILRRYSVPPSERYDFTATSEGESVVREWVSKNPKSASGSEGLIGFLHGGLLKQLRSIPVGLRVDAWISQQYPDLCDLQEKALSRQLNDNAAALRPEVQAMMPDEALARNLAMSAAFALFWSERLRQPAILLPYLVSGYLDRGRNLLNLWNTVPPDPLADVPLVDQWAESLGMREWYKWVKPSAA